MQNACFPKERNFKAQMVKVHKSGCTFNCLLQNFDWINFLHICYTLLSGVSYTVKETSYTPALGICCNDENRGKNRNSGRDTYIQRRIQTAS